MWIRTLFIFIFLWLGKEIYAQAPNITWQKCYGGSNPEIFHYLRPIGNGEFMLVGNTSSNDGDVLGNHGGANDLWIARIDNLGNLLWQRCYGGSSGESSGQLISMADGHFAFIGGTMSNDGDVNGNHVVGFYDGWLVKIDSSGGILSQKCFGGSLHDGFNDLLEVTSGLVLVGGTQSNDGDVSGNHHSALGFSDVWIIKIDTGGFLQWQKCLGGFQSEFANTILKTSDGGYILGCSSNSNDGDILVPYGMFDFWVVKIDSMGNILWEKSYGGSEDEYFYSMCKTDDGGYILVGSTESNDGLVSGNHSINASDSWVVKIDSVGGFEWQKCFGGSSDDESRSIAACYDGGYILNGNSRSDDGDVVGMHNPGFGALDMWLVKIDSFGNLQWQKCLGGNNGDLGSGGFSGNDSTYLAIGASSSFDGDVMGGGNHGNGDTWVVKLSVLSNEITTPASPIADLEVYTDEGDNLYIKFWTNGNKNMQLHLFDVTGRRLLHQKIKVGEGYNNQKLNIFQFGGGIYLVQLEIENTVLTRKMIKY
jgi:hypothetical protein